MTRAGRAITALRTLVPSSLVLGAGLLVAAPAASADPDDGAILQWFEATRNTIEYRMPDFFVAGYKAVWLPPQSRGRDINGTGYDVFDRFDLGSPGTDQFGTTKETLFGTEEDFKAMVEQFHRAGAFVYVDTVLNHNSTRDSSGGFISEGGYPQFYLPASGGNFWGDFHDGVTQSQDPCGANYNLFTGDLVGLIDISVESDNWCIRHPVDPVLATGVQGSPDDPPLNIPAGTRYNKPSAANRRFYPDLSLPAETISNPGYSRIGTGFGCGGCCFPLYPVSNVAAFDVDIHPFNLDDAAAGDPVPENATALLVRWCRWMLEVQGIDGFRLDAAKHMPQWFWDRYFDAHIHDRWTKPDGSKGTPFSFVEAVAGNYEVYKEYVRKDGFANRDALDLSGAGNIRNIIGAKGADSCGNLINGHMDPEDDGFNNGTLGVNHIHSHDNGSTGDGGSKPDFPYEDKVAPWAYAYLLLRTGPPIVYHNAREFHSLNVGRYWPREGVPIALGYGSMQTLPGPVTVTAEDGRIPTVVQLRNRYGRGFFIPRVQDGSVFIYSRQGNCIVGVNDNYVTGYDQRTFNTDFPQGTRLHELTGNAVDPEVDPADDIFDVVTVGSGGSVTIRVPRNGGVANEHNKGYVVYGPATPSGTMDITTTGGAALSLIPADPPGATFLRRLTPISIVQDSQFKISLATTQTDAQDPNTDDKAIFRINGGFVDLNGNALPTYNPDGSVNTTENSGDYRAYENFVTVNSPLYGGGSGQYEQIINADDLPEGMNYVSVIAFRHGGGALGDAVYNEWRKVIYVDRQDADVEITPDLNCLTGNGNISIVNPDQTATRVHAFLDLAPGDPTPILGPGNQAIAWDRNRWLFPVTGLTGSHSIRVVLIEEPGGTFVSQAEHQIDFTISNVPGDVNDDGVVNSLDLYAFHQLTEYECRADLDGNDVNDEIDRRLLRGLIGGGEIADMLANR